MTLTPEQIKTTLETGTKLMNLCNLAENAIEETKGLVSHGVLDDPNVNFPQLRENIVDHLQCIADCMNGSLLELSNEFDSKFNDYFDMISSEGGYSKIDTDVASAISGWIPYETVAYNMLLIPHKVLSYLSENAQNVTISRQDIAGRCMAQGDEAHSIAYILLNTIITRRMLRESGQENSAETLLHMVGLTGGAIPKNHQQNLFDLMEFIRSDEFASNHILYCRALQGDDSVEAKAATDAIRKVIPMAIDALTEIQSQFYSIRMYADFYSALLECIPNTVTLVDEAYKCYTKEFAVTF